MDRVDKAPPWRDSLPCLGIFAKQPRPGEVKTRLCPPLSPEQAAAVYEVSLRETVERMTTLDACRVVLCYAGADAWFAEAFPGIARVAQRGTDLGARMAHALEGFLELGSSRALLIGSDAPDLPLQRIRQAVQLLDTHELVLGPATDGGYYLVGERIHHPELFRGIPWSTGQVLAATRRICEQQSLAVAELEPWEDLDDLAALRGLLARSPDSRTAACLREALGDC